VQCGVRVYKKRITDSPADDGHVEATAGFWVALGDALSKLPAAIIRGPLFQDSTLDKFPWLARVLVWPVIKPLFMIMLGEGGDMVGTRRVSTFSPRDWENTTYVRYLVIAIASAFGGIHCIGWSFYFPSSIERILWRVTSVSITSVPIVLFLTVLLLEYDFSLSDLVSEWLVQPYFELQLFLYVLSRLVLLILPFLSLRSLPPATFHTVQWTSFIPHI